MQKGRLIKQLKSVFFDLAQYFGQTEPGEILFNRNIGLNQRRHFQLFFVFKVCSRPLSKDATFFVSRGQWQHTEVHVQENEKSCGFPQFLEVLANVHECLYNSAIKGKSDYFLYLMQRQTIFCLRRQTTTMPIFLFIHKLLDLIAILRKVETPTAQTQDLKIEIMEVQH